MFRSRRVPVAGAGFVEPCLPSPARNLPSGPGWIHEIKHDGYRMMVCRDGVGVRLFTRRGYDWTDRFPAIRDAAEAVPAKSFLVDGEAVCCDQDGVAVFEMLRQRRGWSSYTPSTCCNSTAEICDATRLRSGRHSSRT